MGKRSEKGDSSKVMVISEFPVDNIIGASDVSAEARKGILEYARHESPDAIIVDGLVSSMKDPEVLLPQVLDQETIEDKIAASIDFATAFLTELRAAAPNAQIYLAKTDADDYNCEQLEKGKAEQQKRKYEAAGSLSEEKITQLRKEIAEAKERGERTLLKRLAGMLGSEVRKLRKLERAGKYKQPQRGSPERKMIIQEAFDDYFGRLEDLNPGVNVITERSFEIDVNGVKVEYTHNAHRTTTPLSNRGSAAIQEVKQRLSAGEKMPDIVIEGGHQAECQAHPIRHKKVIDGDAKPFDKYTLFVSTPAMEDQDTIESIINSEYKDLSKAAGNLEAVHRSTKKSAPAGISIIGKDKRGYFTWLYPLDHLAKVGRGESAPAKMHYNNIHVISDMHCGKSTTRYGIIRAYLRSIREEVSQRIADKEAVPALIFLNEALQGYNYATYPVEFERETPDKVREKFLEAAKKMKEAGLSDDKKLDAIIDEAVKEAEGISMVRIEDQWKMYNELFNETILTTLLAATVKPAAVFCEGNHVAKSVGEKGVTETGLQTEVIREIDRAYALLEKLGMLAPGVTLDSLYDKIRVFQEGFISSYGAYEFATGGESYLFVVEHKPGSGTPRSNAVQRQIERANLRSDSFDVYFAGHQHYASMGAEGIGNSMRYIAKGATFSEHDSYGMAGDWSPPTVGAVELWLPDSKGDKGPAKFWFRLSDVLEEE